MTAGGKVHGNAPVPKTVRAGRTVFPFLMNGREVSLAAGSWPGWHLRSRPVLLSMVISTRPTCAFFPPDLELTPHDLPQPSRLFPSQQVFALRLLPWAPRSARPAFLQERWHYIHTGAFRGLQGFPVIPASCLPVQPSPFHVAGSFSASYRHAADCHGEMQRYPGRGPCPH